MGGYPVVSSTWDRPTKGTVTTRYFTFTKDGSVQEGVVTEVETKSAGKFRVHARFFVNGCSNSYQNELNTASGDFCLGQDGPKEGIAVEQGGKCSRCKNTWGYSYHGSLIWDSETRVSFSFPGQTRRRLANGRCQC